MMKDIEIKINRETRMVDLSKSIIGNDGENLQGNLVFSFADDFVKGQARLEYVIDDEKKYALLLKDEDNYYIPIKSVMTKAGTIDMQLVVTEGTNENEIPIFKSNMFYVTCRTSINAKIEEEEGYYSWIEIANTKLNQVDEAIEELASQSNYAKEQGDYAKEQGTNAKSVAEETEKKAQEGAFDGKSLEFIWQGTKLGVRLEGQEEYQFVDLQGVQGEIGATGEPFKIKKTYASVNEMNADFRNMEFGDYVMIASSVDVEDNAKLYTRGESAWIFISDFSGAMGIRGETGLTPNIKIGEVKTLEAGSQAKVTRSGSNEEPVFNFELPKGDKGDDYVLTEEDKVEIGEKVNTEYEKRIAENEKDIVDIESYLDSLTPKSSAKGELVHITDALGLPVFETKTSGNVKQETTKGQQLFDYKDTKDVSDGVTTDKDGWITMTYDNTNGTSIKYFNYWTRNLNLKENTKYNILCEIKNVSGTGSVFITSFSNTNNPGQFTESQRIYLNNLTNNSIVKLIGTTKENLENSTSALRTYGQFNAGQSGSITFRLSVIEDTTVTPETFVYEPYTGGQASPNPEFPQEVEVLEGYNLFDKNNANILYDTYIGTAGNVGSSPTNNILYLEIKPNTSYTIQKISSNRFRVGTYNSLDVVGKTLNNIITNLNDNATSYTLKNTTDKYLFFQYKGGDTNEQEILDSIMISEGTEKKPYLPYGCVGYKVNGKNLLSANDLKPITKNGITFTPIYKENGTLDYVNVNGTATADINYVVHTETRYPINKEKSYFFSGCPSGGSLSTYHFIIYYYDENKGYLGGVYDVGVGKEIPKSSYILANIFVKSGITMNNAKFYPMLSLDGGEYEPYQEQIVPLDLKGNFIGKINDDIKDYLVTDKKKLWLVKNVGKVVLDGSENWSSAYELTDTIDFYTTITDTSVNGTAISNRFQKSTSWVNITTGDFEQFDLYSNKILHCRIKKSTASTPAEFKAWLSNNNVEVYYQLAEPQIIDLGKLPEPIKTFEGVNNIQLLANLDTEIEVKYALDLKKYYDNKLAEISAQII